MKARPDSEIQQELDALLKQRDSLPSDATLRKEVTHKIVALAWVLRDPKVKGLVLSEEVMGFYGCFGTAR